MTTTKIAWTDHSLQPGVYGCSPAPNHRGCDKCYAAKMARRLAGMGQKAYEGLTTTEFVRQDDNTTREVVQWNGTVRVDFTQMDKAFAKLPKRKPCRVFCTSMGDVMNPKVPYLMAEGVLRRFEARPHLTGLLLTKHPGRMATFAEGRSGWPSNVMAGCSISDQATADRLLPDLLRVKGARLFVSYEPAIGPVDFGLETTAVRAVACECGDGWGDRIEGEYCPICGGTGTTWRSGIGWIICGPETAAGRRPMDPAWAESAAEQCRDAGVPFFLKAIFVDGEKVDDPADPRWPSWAVQQFPGGLAGPATPPPQPTQTSLGVG